MSLFRTTPKVDPTLTTLEEEQINAYTAAFTGPSGDFVISDLYFLTGMASSTFDQADFDPIKAAHLDGMQTVLKRILNLSGRLIHKP